jgi:hypothetical protein
MADEIKDTPEASFLRARDTIRNHAVELFERDGHIVPTCIVGKWIDDLGRFAYALVMNPRANMGERETLDVKMVQFARDAAKKLDAEMAILIFEMEGFVVAGDENAEDDLHQEILSKIKSGMDEKTGMVRIDKDSIERIESLAEAAGIEMRTSLLVHSEHNGEISISSMDIEETEHGRCVKRDDQSVDWMEMDLNEEDDRSFRLIESGGN